jgi:hypothetical protein
MSGTGKGGRKAGSRQKPPATAKGDIPPAHFVASALQLGLAPRNVPISPPQPLKSNADAAAGARGASGAAGTPTCSSSSTLLPPIRCTDGALDALRRCHAEFVLLLASELAAISGGENGKEGGNVGAKQSDATTANSGNIGMGTTTSSSSSDGKGPTKGGGKKRPRNEAVDAATAVADVAGTATSRILTEHDVVLCLERLGMGRVAARAVQNTGQWQERKKQLAGGGGQAASRSTGKRAKKRLKKGYRDAEVTAEMRAEQERLLAESARVMKERLAQQQKEG